MGETINIKEAAAIIGVSSMTLRRWLQSGNDELLVPHWRFGPRKDYKFDKDEVVEWKESQKITTDT